MIKNQTKNSHKLSNLKEKIKNLKLDEILNAEVKEYRNVLNHIY